MAKYQEAPKLISGNGINLPVDIPLVDDYSFDDPADAVPVRRVLGHGRGHQPQGQVQDLQRPQGRVREEDHGGAHRQGY